MKAIIEYFVTNFTTAPVAFSISTATLILVIVICQFKSMKAIVIGQCAANFLVLVTLALGDGLSGAAICALATVQTFLIYMLYQRKGKEIPVWFAAIFVVVYLICSVFTFNRVVDLLPAVAAMLFALSVVQSESWKYRIIILNNSLVWLIYNLIIDSPIPLIVTYIVAVASNIVGIIRLDLKKWFGK